VGKGKYADIIDLPRHISPKRERMTRYDRAAQFSPFAALTGHEDAVKETARLTEIKSELDECEKERLNAKIMLLVERAKERPAVCVTYFKEDGKKEGGAYIKYLGVFLGFDDYERRLVFEDRFSLYIEDLRELEGEIFDNIE